MHRAQKIGNDSDGEIVVPQMTIVHPGIIIGSGSSGVAHPDGLFWRYVAASIGIDCYVSVLPKEREWINLTPVDEVASATVKAAVAENVQKADTEVHRCLICSGLLVSRFWEITIQTLLEKEIHLKTVSERE